jgi:hypothetical protein
MKIWTDEFSFCFRKGGTFVYQEVKLKAISVVAVVQIVIVFKILPPVHYNLNRNLSV